MVPEGGTSGNASYYFINGGLSRIARAAPASIFKMIYKDQVPPNPPY
jgi:hypothetical protein